MMSTSRIGPRRRRTVGGPSVLLSALFAGVSGCTTGTTVENFRPATQPGGAQIHLRLAGGQVSGELLEVTEESLLVLIDAAGPASIVSGGPVRIFRYPIASIQSATVDQHGRVRPRLRQDRDELRLLSRFPQGLDPELERRVLEAYGQTEVGRVPTEPPPDEGHDAFLAAVREATETYADPARAIADGFVAVGADAPAMGRHWIHPERVVAGIEPSRPSVLSFLEVGGERRLAGVGFAAAGGTGVTPDVPGVPAERWHFHSGSMEAEGHRIDHEAETSTPAGRAAVAVLHVWIPIENPSGVFAPDNWALPYVRLGLRPDPDAPMSAAKALSLLHDGGRAFFERQWRLSQGIAADAARQRELESVLRSIEDRLRDWWRARPPGEELSQGTSDWLAAMWADLAAFGL